MSESATRRSIQICSAVCLIACVVLSVYAYQRGLFTSQEALQSYIAGFGSLGAVIFILFQIVQVVIPIIPGGLGCVGGVLLFGPVFGWLYNYIGICLGSIIVFVIAKNCGKPVLSMLFSQKTIDKYEKWTGNESRFAKWFALAIFFPVAPDDFLCYLAGTTQMGWKKYTAIILLGKPASIALYSIGLEVLLSRLLSFAQ